jgi:hypothetical protein
VPPGSRRVARARRIVLAAAILSGCAGQNTAATTSAGVEVQPALPGPRVPLAPPVPAACFVAERDATAGADLDGDLVGDECELDLARSFAPDLLTDPRDCLWQATDGAFSGGEYAFAVRRLEGGDAARLVYAPAYHRDCGWSSRAACGLRARPCSTHADDSELIVVDVAYHGALGGWTTIAVFLSAHCFGRSAQSCRWYRGPGLDQFGWSDGRSRGRPRIWVSRGKHANYPSRRVCERGHWSLESCDARPVVRRATRRASLSDRVVDAEPGEPSRSVPVARWTRLRGGPCDGSGVGACSRRMLLEWHAVSRVAAAVGARFVHRLRPLPARDRRLLTSDPARPAVSPTAG